MHLRGYLVASLASAAAAKTAVSTTVFNNIVHYTRYAGAAYAEDCPKPPFGSSLASSMNFTTIDNKAVVLYESAANQVILSIRGSAYPKNLDQDFLFNLVPLSVSGLSCSGCQVHAGFQNTWNTMRSSVVSAVQSALSQHSGSSLIVTGHSLGGALAAFAATNLAAAGLKPTVYTYGEPRVGNAAWASYLNSLISTSVYYRVTHANDGVPQIAPTDFGYQHHGTEYWESQSTGNTAASTYQCTGSEPTDCNSSQNFGQNPINGAHISYSDILVATALYNPSCGYVQPS